MPEDKLISLIEWVGQQCATAQIDYIILRNQKLEENKDKLIELKTRAKAYQEIWDKLLKAANNED